MADDTKDTTATSDSSATESKTETKADTKADEPLGDAGKAALQKERDAREAAEKEAKRLKKIVDDAEAAKKKADDEAAAKNGEFEKLATDRRARIAELEQQLAERDASALRAKVAAKHKLPDELAELLRGESESDLETHAKTLAKLVKPPVAADTEAGGGGNGNGGARSTKPLDKPVVAGEPKRSFTFIPEGAVAFPD